MSHLMSHKAGHNKANVTYSVTYDSRAYLPLSRRMTPLAAAIRKSGKTANALAKHLDVNRQNVYRWVKGKGVGDGADFPREYAERAAQFLDTTAEFLVLGIEAPEFEGQEIPARKVDTDLSFGLDEFSPKAGAAYGGGIETEEWESGGIEADRPVAHWIIPKSFARSELGLSPGFADVIAVQGDSMDDGTKHGLSSGDRVVIDRHNQDPRQGGIYAVWDGGGLIIKQVEIKRGTDPLRIVCTSLNARYAAFELVLDGSVHIIGRVAAKIARM